MIALVASTTSSITLAQAPPGYWRLVRAIPTGAFGVAHPAGLAFSPAANAFLMREAGSPSRLGGAAAHLTLITLLEYPADDVTVATAIPDLLNMALDPQANRLVFLDLAANELIAIPVGTDGYPVSADTALTRFEVGELGLKDAQGLTFDPLSGRLFILEAATSQIVVITPDAQHGFDGGAALKEGRIARVDLKDLAGTPLRGIAFSPTNGHLYVMSPADARLYELTESGQVVATLEVASLPLVDLQGLVFAPSADLTDDPAIMNLYLSAASSQASQGGAILELSLTPPVLVALPESIQATLVRTIRTSRWNPPSPDPAGIDYWPATGKLLIGDGEVDEMPPYFTGDNVFEATTRGSLSGTCSTTAFSNEPVGVAVNPTDGHIFFSDDDKDKVFEVNLGADGQYCTSDDSVTSFSTMAFSSGDPEGLAYGQGMLFIADGVGREVYKIARGANGIFDGVPPAGDDVVAHFDTSGMGQQDPEGIAYNDDRGTLYIVSNTSGSDITEVTLAGMVVNVIAGSVVNSTAPAGLAYGPGSVNPGVKNLYIADRGVDNLVDPTENDGKVYEISSLPTTNLLYLPLVNTGPTIVDAINLPLS